MTSEKLEERLSTLRAEHTKCLQTIANLNAQRTQFEAQALRIEGAITLVGEMLAESAQDAMQAKSWPSNRVEVPLFEGEKI